MKTKTSELTGRNLNWAVAIALGWKWKVDNDGKIVLARPAKNIHSKKAFDTLGLAYFQPTKSWSTAGPIIEREEIRLTPPLAGETDWLAACGNPDVAGPTPLIAAMRCFVASVLGDEVDIPEELK
jgi:hypothetical protein